MKRKFFSVFLLLAFLSLAVIFTGCNDKNVLVEKIEIICQSSMDVETTQVLTVKVTPDNATIKTVTWSSSTPSVISVDKDGTCTALTTGSATITATADDGSKVKATVTILSNVAQGDFVKSISITGYPRMIVGTNQTLSLSISPKTALDKSVTWSSSDSSIVTVDEFGKVEAVKLGNATITATSNQDNTVKGTYQIEVIEDAGPTNVPNLLGQTFIIMANVANSSDPRSATYQGNWKEEKTLKIAEVEQKYNIKVKYETYPAEAVWGGGRERWITENSINKTTTAHIYEMPSYSIAVLVEAGAILPLDEFIIKYGNKGYWPEKAAFGKVLDKQYSYDDQYPLVGQGIFYNASLIGELLGEDMKYAPSQMWLDGTWTWDSFKKMCNDLLPGITAKEIESSGVMGGRPYNWAYQMLGSNGVHVVSNDLKSELATESGIETLLFLSELCKTEGMWEYMSAALSNASCPQFKAGNIVFHNGEPYWMYDSNKWKDYPFEMGFVPYPKGPNAQDDLSNYYINEVYGKTTYLVSSSYSKDNVIPGYENIVFYDETIFRIWADMQYFPEIDPATGYSDVNPIIDEWCSTTLDFYYGDEVALDAHKSVMTKGYPDYFYSLYYARSHSEEKSFMLDIQSAIISGEVRGKMEDLVSRIHQEFIQTYKNIGLTADYYNK